MENAWTKIDIFTTSEGLDVLSEALFELGHHSLSVVDSTDLEKLMEGKYGAWDYIDPELMKLRETETSVTFYISCDEHEQNKLALLREMLVRLKDSDTKNIYGRLECCITNVKDENWVDSWKYDYDPIIVGEKLMICPTWMDCDSSGRILIRIDPGMAFGTGQDETTRLCLEALERIVKPGDTIFDIGCGSGILSIAALLLGAGSALGIDTDEIAVKTAKENAVLNGVSDNIKFAIGGPSPCCITETYDIVCANIAADAIIEMIPVFPKFLNPGGVLILSGIIKNREQDVVDTLYNNGFSVLECKERNDWVCIVSHEKVK